MQIKTISYERVLNLGNYKNKKMQLIADITPGEDEEVAISQLADTVERKIRESVNREYNKEMLRLEALKEQLAEEVANLKHELKQLGKIKDEPPNNDIPFNPGDTPKTSGDIPDVF